ncbi:hypothetical protein PTNB73_10108 [Pyrenophora teres f. teres]|nr:hypothetical protein PTNB73_10108 [Pyrenophora teres f. teres]
MQMVLELRDDVDEDAFRAAWELVVQLTAVLRTRIVQHSELGLLQVVVEEKMQWTEAEDLEEYLNGDREEKSIGLGDPLTRYALIKEACSEKRWFAWTIHHAIYDGWSLPLILHAVKQVYSGGVLQRQPSFNAFIQYLGQQDHKAAISYWQTALADCEAVLFPTLPSTVAQPVADATVEYQCPPLSKATSDTTTSTLIRAAWAIVASRYTSSDDVVFGATVTGRNAPVTSIDAMLAPTIATVPVRVRVQGDQATCVFLKSLQDQATEMIAHEQTGLQRIAKMGQGPQHACSFQTLLVVQPADDVLRSDDTLGEWRGHSKLQDFTTYALMLQCTLAAEGVQITASFDARVIEQWVVEKILRQLSFIMQQLAEAGEDSKMQVTLVDLTPSVARLIEPGSVPTLRTIVLAGEAVGYNDVSRWPATVRIVNAYGPAECAPMATINAFANNLGADIGIGQGMGVLTWVVDRNDYNVLLAAGQTGELLLEGPLLARGYLHDEERTAAAFVENPAWLNNEEPAKETLRRRFYKTGDLVTYNKDGTLSFVGRRDTQSWFHKHRKL